MTYRSEIITPNRSFKLIILFSMSLLVEFRCLDLKDIYQITNLTGILNMSIFPPIESNFTKLVQILSGNHLIATLLL